MPANVANAAGILSAASAASALAAPASSSPIDDSKHSLLTIPLELRNDIVKLLLVSDTPVKLERPHRGPRTVPCQIPGVNLLFTCRQLYAEATGVFYATNTFEFSAPRGSPDDAVVVVGEWVDSIGSQQCLCVRDLKIDITNSQTAWYDEYWNWLNITPLRSLGHSTHNKPKLQITLSKTNTSGTTEDLRLDMMHTIISALQTQCLSDLRLYLRCRGLLHDIFISTEDEILRLNLDHSSDEYALDLPDIRYKLSGNGRLMRIEPKRHKHLHDLIESKRRISSAIAGHLEAFTTLIVLDANRGTVRGEIPALCQVDQLTRGEFLGHCPDIFVFLSTTNGQTGFDDFQKLHEVLSWKAEVALSDWAFFNVGLDFDVPPQRFFGVRVRAIELLTALQERCVGIWVHLQTEYVTWISSSDLRERLLAFLVYLVVHFPDRRSLPRPIVWMTPTGFMRSAEFTLDDGTTDTVVSSQIDLKITDSEASRKLGEIGGYTHGDEATLFGVAQFLA